MASIARPRRLTEPRSGGQMVRTRQSAANKTPCDRPALSPNLTPQNPNWLSKFIYLPTRLIATGAVFTGESSASSSSSSSEDYSDQIDNEMSPQITDSIKKKRALEVNQQSSETPSIVEKSETKYLIERLIMQVTFSREEFNRLTSTIKSRVVDSPIYGDGEDGRFNLCSAAVSEAKKWLEEKKLGSNSKSDLELGTCILNSAMLPHFKRDSPASGSWNISEELRKVRSKATEEMLRTLPSSKIDLSALTSENRSAVKSIVAEEVEATMSDKVLNSTKSVDASLNLVTGVTTSCGLPGVICFPV
ncbi:protein KAKU4-like [Mangifera indica]|uniref:protein KAKU4-like n=1 Tax=Mangifera indica TaxID=29780 RepID=UPI001CFB7A83|nr:protein KAKU4-like [Mangifera indica]